LTPTATADRIPIVERILIRLPKELLEALGTLAKAKGLSRTAYIRMVLTEHVNEPERKD